MKCAHCDKPDAENEWTLTPCALPCKVIMKLCDPCDARLNRMVLVFFNIPKADELMDRYESHSS